VSARLRGKVEGFQGDQSTCRCHISENQAQRGAAETEGSRRDKSVRSRLGTPSGCAEKGDFVVRGVDTSRISGQTWQGENVDIVPDTVLDSPAAGFSLSRVQGVR